MANCSGTRNAVGSSRPPISLRVKDGSRRYSRSKRSPTSGSTTAAAKPATEVATPRPNVPRPNSSSRNRFDCTGIVNSTKPRATNANSTALTVWILSSRAKAASTEMGAGSGSVITWLRTDVFSH